MADDVRQGLSRALTTINPDYARMVTDRMTEIEEYPAPFLNSYKIYKVLYYGPNKPVLFYVGYAQGKAPYFVTGSMENYVKMAKADRVSLDSEKDAETYVGVEMEVTRPMSGLFYRIDSTDDIKFQRLLDEDDEKTKQELIENAGKEIGPPKAEGADDGFVVTAYAVKNQAVEQHKFTVSKSGDLKDEVTVVARDLPLMFGL